MNTLKYRNLTGIMVFLLCSLSFDSLLSRDTFSKEIVFKALTDELNRNIDSLYFDGYEKPFFIGYTLATGEYLEIYAANGEIISSEKRALSSNSNRVMVGNYQLNDENFIDSKGGKRHNDGYLGIPIEGDYWGIRRAFWLSTNNTYKNAAETYKNKCTAMAQKALGSDEIKIADFTQEQPVKLDSYSHFDSIDVSACENLTKQISAVFNEYPVVYKNEVRLYEQRANIFFVNSEGTEVVEPVSVFGLLIKAFSYTDDFQTTGKFRSYILNSCSELPEINVLKEDIKGLVEELKQMRTLDVFEDSYLGPILFCHQAVPEYLLYNLFDYGNGLLAQRSNLVNDARSGLRNATARTWENRLNKRVVDRSLSVYSLPSLEKYNGVNLIGNYKVDGEGVIPKDTFKLIENGILNNLLIGRTPLEKITQSSGSSRYSFHPGGCYVSLAPGNVLVKSSKTYPISDLKKKLISIAADDGLDYAIIVRSKDNGVSHQGINVYKVNLKDGSEELIRAASLSKIDLETLWEIEGVGNTNDVFNVLFNPHSNRQNSSVSSEVFSGVPVSFIYPDAVLIKRGAIEGMKKPLKGIEPLVPSPL